jgi:hypothetical protein
MRLQQIQDKISENNNLMKSLQNQVTKLSRENSELAHQREMRLIEYFKDYIELGTSYKVTNWMYLTGVQTSLKKDEKQYSPNFQTNDVFEFVKKNAKSIVIKCTTKIKSTYNSTNSSRTMQIIDNPGWIFRIETMSLYQSLMKNSDFAEAFKKYVSRKEALDILGI